MPTTITTNSCIRFTVGSVWFFVRATRVRSGELRCPSCGVDWPTGEKMQYWIDAPQVVRFNRVTNSFMERKRQREL